MPPLDDPSSQLGEQLLAQHAIEFPDSDAAQLVAQGQPEVHEAAGAGDAAASAGQSEASEQPARETPEGSVANDAYAAEVAGGATQHESSLAEHGVALDAHAQEATHVAAHIANTVDTAGEEHEDRRDAAQDDPVSTTDDEAARRGN